jgi:UrcA family protein
MNTSTTRNPVYRLIAIAFVGVLSSSFAALPAATGGFEPPTITVKFADLDVSLPQGASVLYNRIRVAAKNVCSPLEQSGSLAAQIHLNACVDKAIADAVIKVNAPALIAVYGAKTGKTLPLRVASVQGS